MCLCWYDKKNVIIVLINFQYVKLFYQLQALQSCTSLADNLLGCEGDKMHNPDSSDSWSVSQVWFGAVVHRLKVSVSTLECITISLFVSLLCAELKCSIDRLVDHSSPRKKSFSFVTLVCILWEVWIMKHLRCACLLCSALLKNKNRKLNEVGVHLFLLSLFYSIDFTQQNPFPKWVIEHLSLRLASCLNRHASISGICDWVGYMWRHLINCTCHSALIDHLEG